MGIHDLRALHYLHYINGRPLIEPNAIYDLQPEFQNITANFGHRRQFILVLPSVAAELNVSSSTAISSLTYDMSVAEHATWFSANGATKP